MKDSRVLFSADGYAYASTRLIIECSWIDMVIVTTENVIFLIGSYSFAEMTSFRFAVPLSYIYQPKNLIILSFAEASAINAESCARRLVLPIPRRKDGAIFSEHVENNEDFVTISYEGKILGVLRAEDWERVIEIAKRNPL